MSEDTSYKSAIVIGTFTGLVFSLISVYLRVTLGVLGAVGGSIIGLLLAKPILEKSNQLNKKTMTIVLISFSAASAAESKIGILFLIWFANNHSIYGINETYPSWFLPSREVLQNRVLFTTEWLLPLLVHYMLMLIPGLIGIALGKAWMNNYNDSEEYPFPGAVQARILAENISGEGKHTSLFYKAIATSFILVFIMVLFNITMIDLSNPAKGFILGIFLGPVGMALYGSGFLIRKNKITITALITSLSLYIGVSALLIGGKDLEFYDYYTFLLSGPYFSFIIGGLGGLVVGPILNSFLASVLFKRKGRNEKKIENESDHENHENSQGGLNNTSSKEENTDLEDIATSTTSILQLENHETSESSLPEQRQKVTIIGRVKQVSFKSWILIGGLSMVLYVFILQTNLLPKNKMIGLLIIVLLFWNIIIGTIVVGFFMTEMNAKTASSIDPPFVFDMFPLYVSGVRQSLSYLAFPSKEVDGVTRLALVGRLVHDVNLPSRTAFIAFMAGYLASTITTPLFSLLLWFMLGIGTPEFPAPLFPVSGNIIKAFTTSNPLSILNYWFLVGGFILVAVLSSIDQDFSIAVIIGAVFIPHMAIPLFLGTVTSYFVARKLGEEFLNNQGNTIAVGLSVGGVLVLIPMLLFLFLGG